MNSPRQLCATARRRTPILWIAGILASTLSLLALPSAGEEAQATTPAALGSWSRVGSKYPNHNVATVTVQRGKLYIGGYFTELGVPFSVKYGNGCDDTDTTTETPSYPLPTTRCVARWNGNEWSNLGGGIWGASGTGLLNLVNAIVDDGTFVYVGGKFTMAGDSKIPAGNVARWNGTSWSAMSSGLPDGTVLSMVLHDSQLYAGGGFGNYLAKWTGSAWGPVGSGVGGTVHSLASNGTNLFVGGTFGTAGGGPAENVAMWNGTSWSALGAGVNGLVSALIGDGSDVYAGGSFTAAGGSGNTEHIAKWTGSSWEPVGVGLNGNVTGLAFDSARGLLYASGAFTAENGGTAGTLNRVATFDTAINRWIPLQEGGTNDPDGAIVGSVAVDGNIVYIGGPGIEGTADGGYQSLAQWTWSAPTGTNTLSATAGDDVTITGNGFVGVPTTGGVKFGPTTATYTRTSTGQITATVPAGLATGTYTISVNGVGGWADVGTASVTALPPPPAATPTTPEATSTTPTSSPTVAVNSAPTTLSPVASSLNKNSETQKVRTALPRSGADSTWPLVLFGVFLVAVGAVLHRRRTSIHGDDHSVPQPR